MRHSRDRFRALSAEEGSEGSPNVSDVDGLQSVCDESERELVDEVSRLRVVEFHELVRFVHAGVATVGGEDFRAEAGAAEEGAKELVEVGEETALVGGAAGVGIIGRLKGGQEDGIVVNMSAGECVQCMVSKR